MGTATGITEITLLPFLTTEWAEAVREAVDGAPDEPTRAGKQDAYWEWLQTRRESYSMSWALEVRDQRSAAGAAHLRLGWRDGRCAEASVTAPGEPVSADFVVTGTYDTWRGLLTGEQDPTRAVLYRHLRLDKGEAVFFFRGLFLFVESLAAMARLPTRFAYGPSDGQPQETDTNQRGRDV
jgi:hypothetical protein